MLKRFLRLCSMLLVIVMLANMLPLESFAAQLQATASENVTALPSATQDAQVVGEVIENRTEFSKEFKLSNGLSLAAVYPDPIHYQKDGQWEEIDNTLKADTDGTYTNTAGVWDVRFPQQLSSDKQVAISKDGYTLSFAMSGELRENEPLQMTTLTAEAPVQALAVSDANTVQAQIQLIEQPEAETAVQYEEIQPDKLNSRLIYNEVYDNTDVVYDLDSNTVKESIILESYSATLRGYRYTLDVGELVPVLAQDGRIDFYDAARENIVMVMPAPYLLDANNVYCGDIQVELTGSGSTYTLSYILPGQWLADAERAWPVVLDPIVTPALTTTNIQDHTVTERSGYGYTWAFMEVGWDTSFGVERAFLKYKNLPQLTSSDVVIEAAICLYNVNKHEYSTTVEVHKVNSTWDSSTLTWSNKPGYDENVEDFAVVKGMDWYSWTITDIVRGWYSGENTGMMFKVPDSVENAEEVHFKGFFSSDYSDYNGSKPALYIAFRNNNGLEGYWDYTSSSAGRAGTGHVNNFTGNLVWTRDDIGFGGSRMPVTISHVYNANDSTVPNDSNNANNTGGNTFGLGYGWRTNFHQRVYRWNIDDDYYVWEDEDGTDQYFFSQDGVLKDEATQKLTLTTNGSGAQKYCIEDENGGKTFFDENGRLTSMQNNQATVSSITVAYDGSGHKISTITDGAGRKYHFTYTDGMLTRISYHASGQDELSYVTFGYTDNRLTTITDKDGGQSHYTYNSDNLLLTAQDIDGYKLTYTYTTREETYQPYRVSSITESHGEAEGGTLNMEYHHNQTTLTDHNGNKQILQFNDLGNTICIQDDEGRAQYAQYARNTHNDTGKSNQLRVSSNLQYTVANLMVNNTMRYCTDGWETYGENVTMESDDTACYADYSALTVTAEYCDEGGPPRGVESIAYTLAPHQTHTFSAHVYSRSCNVYLMAKGPTKTETSEQHIDNSKWQRLQVTYTNDTEQPQQVRYYVVTLDSAGTFHVDGTQLELAPTASRYNLVNNGDFVYSDDAYGWATSGCDSGDGVITLPEGEDPAAPQMNRNVFKITGDPTDTRQLFQNVDTKYYAGRSFTLCGWAKGNSAPLESFGDMEDADDGEREFAIKCVLHYNDGTDSKPFFARFNPDSDDWQYAATGIIAEKDMKSLSISLIYNYNVNTVYFDGIQLVKDSFGTAYTYDDDGNVITTTADKDQATTYEYTDNDLTKQIMSTGAELTYTYDDYHNVLTATTEENLQYTFTYDEYGNNTAVSITQGDDTMTSTATYSDDGNRLASTTDTAGNITAYGYDPDTNVLTWVKYPNDQEANKTTYEYDDMLRMTKAAVTTDTGLELTAEYTYDEEKDLLTQIATGTTTYDFEYGAFGQRSSIKIGEQPLASYTYTNDKNRYLFSLDYGNEDKVQYQYDSKGRVTTQTFEDGDTVSYTYDNSGALATVTDHANNDATTSRVYDYIDRLGTYKVARPGLDLVLRYTYGNQDRITALREEINGYVRNVKYSYDTDNRLQTFTKETGNRTYIYDGFDRVSQMVTKYKTTTSLTTDFTFAEPADGKTSSQVTELTHTYGTSETHNLKYTYTYDLNGNILSVSDGTNTTSYVYDSANQLIRENNQAADFTHTWTYDSSGNIQSRNEYAYTTGDLGDPTKTVTYDYSDGAWKDLLIAYDGEEIESDEIGNMVSDGTWTYEWEHGRQLASMSNDDATWTYTYDADGLRTKRTDGDTTYEYVYYDGLLQCMYVDGTPLYFTHTPDGAPMGVVYQKAVYFYVTNLQGDVVALVRPSGEEVVRYTYDAWGNVLSITGSRANAIGAINPIRYRGYVYDRETNLYYLQSRYYNPEIGRWINVDCIVAGEGGNIKGDNLFVYCFNNPINMDDQSGNWPQLIKNAADWLNNKIIQPVASLVKDITEDIKNYDSNNQSEETVLKSNYFSAYKGVPVIRTNGNRSGSFGAIFLTRETNNRKNPEDVVRHEYGHTKQLEQLGVVNYALCIALPSWQQWGTGEYYSKPWEITADLYGGVQSRSHYESNIVRGLLYLGGSQIIGPLIWVFIE